MAKYSFNAINQITKDGHTMFSEDVIKELNRLKWLEEKLDNANELLNQIYECGADLNELEKPVHDYLTKQL